MLLHRISPEQIYYPLDALRAVNTISNLCLTVNSSVNFVIYCVVGRRFRDVLVKIICCDAVAASPSHRRSNDEELRPTRDHV